MQFKTDQILCGDSELLLSEIPNNSVDLIITSPPYNFGMEYDEVDDNQKWDDYFGKLFRILDQCSRVLVSGGRLCINIQPFFSEYIASHHLISHYLIKECGLIWRNEILWEKNTYNAKFTSWGSWKSPSCPYIKYTWEFIEVYCKDSIKKEGFTFPDITADEFKSWVNGKWSIAPEKNMRKWNHPAMFPTEIPKRLIKLFSFPGDLVLDPFNGAGTTTYVAKVYDRRYLGMDISDKYCEIAKRRLANLLV